MAKVAKEEFSRAERIIIRNQRYIMLALANLSANAGGTLAGHTNQTLHNRVREMERAWDWIASPSERL